MSQKGAGKLRLKDTMSLPWANKLRASEDGVGVGEGGISSSTQNESTNSSSNSSIKELTFMEEREIKRASLAMENGEKEEATTTRFETVQEDPNPDDPEGLEFGISSKNRPFSETPGISKELSRDVSEINYNLHEEEENRRLRHEMLRRSVRDVLKGHRPRTGLEHIQIKTPEWTSVTDKRTNEEESQKQRVPCYCRFLLLIFVALLVVAGIVVFVIF